MSAAGIQAGFGGLLGSELLGQIRDKGFNIVRLDCQENSDHDVTVLAQEVIDEGMQPLVIVRRPEALRALPQGALGEFGNEPDLKAHFGWPTFGSYWRPCQEAIRIALELDIRLYIGVVSNLNDRGFRFLNQMPWDEIDPKICCSIHRYPVGSHPPTVPQPKQKSRDNEIAKLKDIVGKHRPLANTEFGYHHGYGGYSDAETEQHVKWEREFYTRHNFDFSTIYQLNDGVGTDALSNYGLRRADGTWRDSATMYTRGTK